MAKGKEDREKFIQYLQERLEVETDPEKHEVVERLLRHFRSVERR